MTQEEWKEIKGYEGIYQISSFGRVKNISKNIILKSRSTSSGYFVTTLCRDGKARKKHVHRLVAMCFLSGFEKSLQVHHLDFDKSNNHYSNLKLVTPKQNALYYRPSGKRGVTWHKGDKKWRAQIMFDTENIYIGSFENKEDAYNAFKIKYIELHGVDPW